ncbi:TPA: thiol peroxidase [Vibrio cholerae]|uniref:Thiol peroxidase n=2 Tax=Vibrio cholerae TaxID=666 RepID=TPX_VIBC3|nr:thiol peroxidase [Vibrio cholerae]A5F3A2.1 RecName: Full=Thiol peroxidase; Short=Tpx; AltName: Full=Peroxiredoxin tpx; Short=Prx; AltName: Full=Thioredoxin peroxidase; AltName: Full=Thioredoxin-dependent peroxiredoxin [Vibrio cholerae O395]HAS2386418.1 thiol peroxidase [Vibrio cholerae O1]AAA64918.1 proposed tagD product [Vibrio cholerae]AAK20751.1 toxR-activated gene D protein [Vibrio cholerae]ABQ20151.1 tagD protein [Vibrio cholerae O395]ACP08855.1 tagD protein [Vibrio cholerae O395]
MTVTFQNNPVSISGSFPKVGDRLPSFTLCGADLNDLNNEDFKGKKIVMSIFPSIDTPVCSKSVKVLQNALMTRSDTVLLCVSADLPFAMSRFCTEHAVANVTNASFFREPAFTERFGVNLNEGALRGLAARAVIVADEFGVITHSELVNEITNEPDYDRILMSL